MKVFDYAESDSPDADYLGVEADPETGSVKISVANCHDLCVVTLDRVTAHRLGRFLMAYDRKGWE